MGGPTILWDFDGTLASRPGRWSGTLLEVLDEHEPGHGITREDLRDGLRDGLPWHEHHLGHEHLNAPTQWWRHVQAVLVRALGQAGVAESRARELAAVFPDPYLTPGQWVVAQGAIEALASSSRSGWSNVIVRHRTPELPDLVESLGLGAHVTAVATSARHGYEKPHPRAFEIALSLAGDPDIVWMVGDNPIADVAGATRVGIPSIWIQTNPVSHEALAHLDHQYGHSGWSNWREDCKLTATGPRQAVELILSQHQQPR